VEAQPSPSSNDCVNVVEAHLLSCISERNAAAVKNLPATFNQFLYDNHLESDFLDRNFEEEEEEEAIGTARSSSDRRNGVSIMSGRIVRDGRVMDYSITPQYGSFVLNIEDFASKDSANVFIPVSENLRELIRVWSLSEDLQNTYALGAMVLACARISFIAPMAPGNGVNKKSKMTTHRKAGLGRGEEKTAVLPLPMVMSASLDTPDFERRVDTALARKQRHAVRAIETAAKRMLYHRAVKRGKAKTKGDVLVKNFGRSFAALSAQMDDIKLELRDCQKRQRRLRVARRRQREQREEEALEAARSKKEADDANVSVVHGKSLSPDDSILQYFDSTTLNFADSTEHGIVNGPAMEALTDEEVVNP